MSATVVQSTKVEPGAVGTSVALVFGAGPTSGNLMLAFVSYSQYFGGAGYRSISGPSGWTQIAEITSANDTIGAWWKIAGAGESATQTWTINDLGHGDEWFSGVMYEIASASAVAPINAFGTSTDGGSTTAAAASASVTPSVSNCLALYGITTDTAANGGQGATAPGGWTLDQSARPQYHSTYAASATSPVSGATAVTLTLTNADNYAGVLVLVAPSGGGGGVKVGTSRMFFGLGT